MRKHIISKSILYENMLHEMGKCVMIEKEVKERDVHADLQVTSPHSAYPALSRQSAFCWGIFLCGLAFILCTLLMVTPLSRVGGSPILAQLPGSPSLEIWGSWLPMDFHFATDPKNSMLSTSILLFFLLAIVAFIIYGTGIWLLRRRPRETNYRQIVSIIGLTTFIAGLIFVLTPAMLSHDIYVYAGYGRIIAAHHANPYFTPLTAFPNDPFMILDDWAKGIAAYGPVWLTICAAFAWVLGSDPLHYIIAFRLLGLLAHLLNAVLVYNILQKMGRSPRTVVLGTLLYTWNPLALMESALGSHNDIVMITFILLGTLLTLRGEQRGLTQPGSYLPPIVAFTIAGLIKYTSGPLILFFLVILAQKAYREARNVGNNDNLHANWLVALIKPVFACIVGGVVALAFYLPYWIGHSIWSIIHSFSNPPSSIGIEFSLMSAINAWIMKYGYPPTPWSNTLFRVFDNHNVWNTINVIVIACTILAGILWLWRTPTLRVFILATLLTLGSLLIVTPWFFPWYVVWLVALVALVLPARTDTIGILFTVFALVFSASAFCVYLFGGYEPIGRWIGWDCLTTIGPPVLAFLSVIIIGKMNRATERRKGLVVVSNRKQHSS